MPQPNVQPCQETSHWQQIKENFSLIWLKLRLFGSESIEWIHIAWRYYLNNGSFAITDLKLLLSSLWNNPFRISKRFLMEKGAQDIYAYGETPLLTWEQIAREANIRSNDTLFELGCGRGRTCFWTQAFIKCRVIGIEYIPAFVEQATELAKSRKLDKIYFKNQDMIDADLSSATVIYLYGTCLSDETMLKLAKKFSDLPRGTKIITVSESLLSYVPPNTFEVMNVFPAKFTWGIGDVYLQIRI